MILPTDIKCTIFTVSSFAKCLISCLVLISCLLESLISSTANAALFVVADNALNWDHVVDLNADFRILWKIINQDITFEIQARTLGYVGFGFSPDGNIAGSDMAIGWVDRGQTYFQDRHLKRNGDPEPIVDPSQDYMLMLGYENKTHTVLRFRRKLDTCDNVHDIPITKFPSDYTATSANAPIPMNCCSS